MNEELRLGSKGENVIILKQKLKQLGLYNALINDEFNLSTEVGVKAFQRLVELDDTGIVDSITWNLLNNYTGSDLSNISNFSLIKVSPSSYDIKDIQTKLKALLYYTGPINGEYDIETENALKRFQLNNGISATGTLNSTTYNLLNKLYGNLNDCVKELFPTDDTQSNDTYTVVKGDTLWSIARKLNTTVDELVNLNNLNSNILEIGQVLKIPSTKDNYSTYTVQRGDTLYGLAIKFDTTVDELKRINNLTSNLLNIGQILNVPNTNNSSLETYIDYVVVRGDTLYKIASDYNVSVNTLRQLNNLTSDILQIGQILKVPSADSSSDNDYIKYTVKRNDTLYSISREFNTSVDNIKSINNLSNNTLSIGQVLYIPRK